MRMKRVLGLLLSAVLSCQFVPDGLPAMSAAAQAQSADVSLDVFAGMVQTLTAADSGRQFYDTLEFDAAAGTLTADGEETGGAIGELYVEDGTLLLHTGDLPDRSGTGTTPRYTPFTEAAEAYGYTYTQAGDTLTITNEFQTARLIVKAAGSIDTAGAVSAAEGYNDLHILQYDTPEAAYAAYQRYASDSAVQYVQPSHRIQLGTAAQTEYLSGSALTDTQTHSYNTWGADMIGTEDFIGTYLNAELLPEVIVSVVDTGINMVPALFEGRVLTELGVNFSDSGDDSADDDYGHGTHCSGTICELTPSNVKLLPVKTFDLYGSAADEQIYLGIVYSIEQGADVINMSFGGLGVSPLEIEALAIAEENGVVCCAAAGNNGDDAAYYYPGGIASCITVGAVDSDMSLAAFSNYGKRIDVVAPGVGIASYVTGETERLESWNGTSMATPHVSACCALLRSYDPEMTPRRIEALLQRNAADLGETGFDSVFGWGLVCLRDLQWDDGICMAPEFSEDEGNYGVQVTVELSCETEGAEIYYTLDGSIPTPETGLRYTDPINLTETAILLAVAAKDGYVTSTVSEAAYTIGGKDVADAFEAENGVLVKYRGAAQQLTVPETVGGAAVTAVGEGAFAGNRYVKQIILPDSVECVGDRAFADCTQLQTVSASGVRQIGEEAFAGCSALLSVTAAPELTRVGASAFAGCAALVSVDLTGISEIPASLCKSCGALRTVKAPDAVTIGDNAFLNCMALETLDCGWTKVTAIGNSALSGCTKWQGKLCLDALETLGEGAFSGDSSLLRVSLPARITVLPAAVFYGCAGLLLLQLPGVTQISDNALAIGNTASGLTAELNYAAVTKVGTNAFSGFPIGSGYDTVTFSSLETIGYRSFAGAYAGALAFPLVTEVPQNAFSGGWIGFVCLEQAEKLEKNSLNGCVAAVLSAAAVEIDPDACPEGTWICTLDEIPALQNLSEPYEFCDEPLVIRWTAQEVTAVQHSQTVLNVLAGGVGLTYQWYRLDGETQTALAGETAAAFVPDSSAAGETEYLCLMTDAGGKTEQIRFRVTVTAETEVPEQLHAGTQVFRTDCTAVQNAVNVSESGRYTLTAAGGAPVSGILTDRTGRTVGTFSYDGTVSAMTVSLAADERYTLYAAPMWEAAYSLLLTADTGEKTAISGCTVTAESSGFSDPDAAFVPAVTVTTPDGSVLTEGSDYVMQTVQHNQNCTVALFGIGAYGGYAEQNLTVYPRVAADTVIPVSLSSGSDRAVFAFVPRVSGTYYYYATYGAGYAKEMTAYYRNAAYPAGARYANLRTQCTVSDRADGLGTILGITGYSAYTGYYFSDSIELNAGQTYYFTCYAGSAAEYSLVITQTLREMRRVTVSGDLYGFYRTGKSVTPDPIVTWNGTQLTEGADYQLIHINNDAPGTATVLIAGMGLYSGTVSKQYVIDYQSAAPAERFTELNAAENVTCNASRIETVWFTADQAETAKDTVRYRVINERMSGAPIKYVLYYFHEAGSFFSQVSPMSGQTDDYLLKNGTYCIVAYRQYANVPSSANFTVVLPYSLTDAAVTVGDMPYTGSEVFPPITVIAADGTELTAGRDYMVSYPDRHTMFGTTRVLLRATNRSFGSYTAYFEIYVELPEDAPEITVGAHEASVTFDDRLALYRLTAAEETTYTLTSADVTDIVLRVFSPEAELLAQDYGHQTKCVSFTVPAGETRYLMIKFNGTDRCGTIRFQLETALRLLTDCDVVSEPVLYTGERVLPQITFTDGDRTLVEDVDYTLRYTCNDVRIGTATANFIGMGDYFGSCDVTYHIVAECLPEIEDFAAFPVALDTVYVPAADLENEYVIARYTAGLDDGMKLSVYNAECRLAVQRYDADGHFADSVFIDLIGLQSSGEMRFDLAAGETCYLLFSAQDVSASNQAFRFLLSDPGCPDFKTVADQEHGVTYRVFPSLNYAEVYKLNTALPEITLLPQISGVPVMFVQEGLFTRIPDTAVVYGYAGCAAADYAGLYGFAYAELSGGEALPEATADPGDLTGDGQCTLADAVLLSHILSEHEFSVIAAWQLSRADQNGDGLVTALDLTVLLERLNT